MFEEKAKYLLNSLVKSIEDIYSKTKSFKKSNDNGEKKLDNKTTEKDLLDEFYEDKQNKYYQNKPSNNRKGSKFSNDDNFKKGGWQGHKDDFVVGGKKIVLKGNKKDEPSDNNTSNNTVKKYRDRSRENEIPNDYNNYANAAVNYYNQAFTIPRGFFRNPNIRGGRFPILSGFNRVPNEMPGFMRVPGIRPRAPFQKNIE